VPKLRTLSGDQARAILEAHGFKFVSQRGSHMKLEFVDESGTRTVIVPRHSTLQSGTLGSIIR
jgi:predicted RNA binding protein YcfA (HicA-like mRNA interferase family)